MPPTRPRSEVFELRDLTKVYRVGEVDVRALELEGLADGDTVVLHPSNRLSDGVRVSVSGAGRNNWCADGRRVKAIWSEAPLPVGAALVSLYRGSIP